MATDPFLIGLTGPIGCGKSTVGRMLADLGGLVIDADELAREATAAGAPTLPAIRQRFGDSVFGPDGTLDRAALAEVVFADPDALVDLEKIVHPAVRRLVNKRLAAAADDQVPFAVIEAIKLVEGGLTDRCNEVWLVECDSTAQRARLAARGSSPDDIERRIATQGSDLVGRLAGQLSGRVAVRRLITNGTLAETREAVEDMLADALEPTLD
jgi:dephospho-CoA kinase